MMPETQAGFVTSWFLNSLVKKGAVAFLAALTALLAGPHLAPILHLLGITVVTVSSPEPATVITILHGAFAAGAGAVLFMLFEGLRVFLAKHPIVKLPGAVKKIL